MTNKFCDDALNEENSSDDRTELDKNLETPMALGDTLSDFRIAQQKSVGSIIGKSLESQLRLRDTLSAFHAAQQKSIGSIIGKSLESQLRLGDTLSAFRAAQQKSFGSIIGKSLESQLRLGDTLSAFRAAQQKSFGSIIGKSLESQLRLGDILSAFRAAQQNNISSVLNQNLIDYFSAQLIIQNLESSSDQNSKNSDDLAVSSPNTSEEKNYASTLIHILFWIFLSITSSPIFKKWPVDALFDLSIAFVFEYALKPLADEAIKNDSEKDKCDTKTSTDISNQETLNTFLSNKRVITATLNFFELPKKKSSIIENLPPGTLLTVIPDKNIHKSWLKVKVTLDQSEVEGYVLRRYTSPIK
ncbi:hypothetical protein [Acinetobacter sp. ANC 4177]|uniref:hypothetical protein n=1 Tax=Acinetobacter sp. ANC 4177 TaxID=2529838 RepID=UPI00103BA9DE|nr:hypothetical protein [Acinetobacter sp. ANC 4177]TCB74218.1 hypothetical protein E0H91_09895 [Acinetobacter sp. ANC 4177]